MHGIRSILSALALFGAASLVPTAAQADGAEPVVIKGNCNYSDQLAPLIEQQHFFAECDRLVIHHDGAQTVLAFSHPSRLRLIEFRAVRDATGRSQVSAVRLRSQRDWEKADGQCEQQMQAEGYPTVTCLVRSGPFFYVTNFVPDR